MIDRAAGPLALLVTAAAALGAQPAFDGLLADLQHPRAANRIRAARALATSGHPHAAGALVPLLADPANAVQLEAIDALVGLALVPVPASRRPQPWARQDGSIAGAVFEAGPLAVLPRAWPPEAAAGLVSATRDEDRRVRRAAAYGLGVMIGSTAGDPGSGTLQALATDLVSGLRHTDPATRAALAHVVGSLFLAAPGQTTPVALADGLIAAMNDADVRVRVAAAESLGWLREPRAVQALTERLQFHRRGEEAAAALHALARIGHSSSAPLFRSYLDDRQPELRVMALEGLGRLQDDTAIPSVAAALRGERRPAVLLAGAFAFYLLGEPANLDQVVTALTNPATARQARVYLTELTPGVAPALHPWLRHPDAQLRQAVAEVLGLSGHRASESTLPPIVKDPDPEVAEAARQALLRLRALPRGARVR